MSTERDDPYLSVRQRKLVRRSFRCVARRYNVIASLMFDRLFELDPSLRPYFPDDLRPVNRKVMETLALLVQRLDEPDAVAALAHKAATRAGVVEPLRNHHATIRQAFLWALRYGLATGYNGEVESAWARLFAHAIAAATRSAAGDHR